MKPRIRHLLSMILFLACLVFTVLTATAGPGIIGLTGTTTPWFTNRLLTVLSGTTTTNLFSFTNTSGVFGDTNAGHVQYTGGASRWEWWTNFTGVAATNDLNRSTGTWHRVTGGALYGTTAFQPRAVETISSSTPGATVQSVFKGDGGGLTNVNATSLIIGAKSTNNFLWGTGDGSGITSFPQVIFPEDSSTVNVAVFGISETNGALPALPLFTFAREDNGNTAQSGTFWSWGTATTENYFMVSKLTGAVFQQGDIVHDVLSTKRSFIIKAMAVSTSNIAGLELLELHRDVGMTELPPYNTALGTFNNSRLVDQYGKTFIGNLGDHVDDPAFLVDLETNHPHAWLQIRGQSDRTPSLVIEPGKISTNSSYRWFQGAIQFDGTNFFGTTKSSANVTNNYQFLQAGLPGNGAGLTNVATTNMLTVADARTPRAGELGETNEQWKALGGAQALVSTVGTNVCSITLSAGSWAVSGSVTLNIGTTLANASASITSVSQTVSTDGTEIYATPFAGACVTTMTLPPKYYYVASTLTVYTVTKTQFTGTGAAFGRISAVRIR